MRSLIALATLTLLVACTTPVARDDAIRFDVTGPQAGSEVNRLDHITVRTFMRRGLSRAELTGLPCTATGTGLRATFTSPATLAAPTYLGRTDPITVTCQRRTDTVQSASKIIKPTNQTEEDLDTGLRIGVNSNDGVSVRLGVSIRDKTRDRFDYPSSVLIDFPS